MLWLFGWQRLHLHLNIFVRHCTRQGFEMSIKELDGSLSLLEERKRKVEQQESERSMEIMLAFLHCLKRQKIQELTEIEGDLQYIKEDIKAVERRRLELYQWEQERSLKLRRLASVDQHSNGIACSVQYIQARMPSINLQNKGADENAQASSNGLQAKDAHVRPDMQCVTTQGVVSLARKRRVHSQFNDLQELLLAKATKLEQAE